MEFDFKNEFESMMKSNELDTVVVLGHINPDGDAAGSVMGIVHYIELSGVSGIPLSGGYDRQRTKTAGESG